ncbi:MAG TPA: LysR family transcriptional regulator [Planctomycetota bacterium]|jgi:DNA-binding transcriptional LysR family regulator
MPPLRIHQLEGFYHVARLGNYTRAAQAFSYPIGQPAVYQQVRGLQEDTGLTLVRQAGPRRTELTPEGRALFEFIAPFFEGLPRVLEKMKGAASGPLVLATDQFLAMSALPPALLKVQRANPEFHLRMDELPAEDIISYIRGGQADAGLVHLSETPRGIRWEALGRIGVALLVPTGHPLADLGHTPTPQEIARHRLIVYGPSSARRILTERLFREYGEHLKVAAEVGFSQTMRALVRAGLAPAFVPFLLSGRRGNPTRVELPHEPQTVCFDVSFRLRGGALPFGLLYRAGIEHSVAFQVLARALRETWG